MKRKSLIFMLTLALVAILVMSVVACNNGGTNTDKGNNKKNNKVNITVLPDMVDYGASSEYYKDGITGYSDAKKAEWTADLDVKRDDERENWLIGDEVWSNDTYNSFGPIAVAYGKTEEARQSNIGYFNVEGDWIDDESANVVERVFCYSTSEAFIDRMDRARLETARMDKLVAYICREDTDREKGTGYTYEKGTSSAIEDYNQLDELYEIYDDFDAYKNDSSYKEHIFADEDEVSDAVSMKKRKIFAEVIEIYGEEADQFARSAIELVSYAIEILDDTMLGVYNEEFGKEVSFEDYMRNEVYDYETLCYLLTFKERASLSESEYKAGSKKDMMTLYGYYYQYEKGEYEVFDDSVMVTVNNKQITEYQDSLILSHKDYYNTESEAERNAEYDRRLYAKAYRYSSACYKKYYSAQLAFQSVQESYDKTIYVGGAVSASKMGQSETEGQYKKGIGAVDTDGTTYSSQMQLGCETGLDSTLKLSDVNWEYTGEKKNVLQYNSAAKGWYGLTESQQEENRYKIKYVKLELEQLKSQDYTINHATIEESDLTKALQYEIYSYSADSIRGIQSCKKDEVIYYKDIDRFLSVDANNAYTYQEIIDDENTANAYRREALLDLEETAGRNDAKYVNLNANYTAGTIGEQVSLASSSDWKGVKSNIKETLNKDYEAYAKTHNDVDEYFENTLIRKKYSCGADLDSDASECGKGNGHVDCTEEYDTDWALSRLLNNHEKVIRYTAGQYEVTFKSISTASITAKEQLVITSDMKASSITSRDLILAGKYSSVKYNQDSSCDSTTLDYNDEIGSIVREQDSSGNYRDVDTYLTKYWKNVPTYEGGDSFSCDKDGTITVTKDDTKYTYTFIGWYVDQNFKYRVDLDEAYNYDLRLYPAYRIDIG